MKAFLLMWPFAPFSPSSNYKQHCSLSKELFTHIQVSGQLHREKEELIRLLEECRREIDIKSDIQEEQAKRTTKYNKDIKEARKKVRERERERERKQR